MTEHDTVDPDTIVDTALRRYHRAGPRPGPAELAVIRQRVLARTVEPVTDRRPVRTVAVAVAASCAVAAGVIALWPSGSPDRDAGTSVAARPDRAGIDAITKADGAPATMDLVVARVANAQPLDLRDGGHLYTSERALSVRSVPGEEGPAYYVAEDVTERWSTLDGGTVPVLMRTTSGLNARPLTAADGERLARYGANYTEVTTSTFDSGTNPKGSGPASEPGLDSPTPAYLASLPTDPAQLLAVLRAAVAEDGPEGDRQVFKSGAALATMCDALLSPPLRAALYQALAMVPGVERIPGQVDLASRPGVAIAHTFAGTRTEIVIDPASTRTLGFRMVAVTDSDGIPAGTVTYSATANQKVVDRVGDR